MYPLVIYPLAPSDCHSGTKIMVDFTEFTKMLPVLRQEFMMTTHPCIPCSQVIMDLIKDCFGLLHPTIEVGLDSVTLKHCSVSSE